MAIPEKPTPVERFIQLIPLRYPLAVLAWTIILGPVGYRLANFLQTGVSPFQFPSPYNEFFGLTLTFYLFYIIRYLRLRVVRAEPRIIPIVQDGEKAYHSFFGRLSDARPVILLGIVLEILALLAGGINPSFSVLTIYNITTQFILLLSFATLIWEYSISSWGLHELGRSQLRLKSFLEDRFMGARSIGNVALSLTLAYLGGLILFLLDSATFLPLSPGLLGFFLILLGLGVGMFFLPLNSVHGKMQAEKAEQQRTLGHQFLAMKHGSEPSSSNDPVLERQSPIEELVRLKNLEITERKLASTATWPFDAQLLAKLITIIVSITAVLLSRVITDLLHI